MAYPQYLRLRTRELRIEKQLTLDELVERLALPKSTVYYWIKDLPLGRPRRASAGQRKGNDAMQARYRRLREEAYRQGRVSFDHLALVPTFRDFVVLYIAEGYKRNRNVVSICNSDGKVMALAARWIRSLSSHRCGYALQYHADQDLVALGRYWGDILEIDALEIQLKRKTNSAQLKGRSWRSQYGVLTMYVCDTMLRARLEGWMDRIKANWGVDSPLATGRGAVW